MSGEVVHIGPLGLSSAYAAATFGNFYRVSIAIPAGSTLTAINVMPDTLGVAPSVVHLHLNPKPTFTDYDSDIWGLQLKPQQRTCWSDTYRTYPATWKGSMTTPTDSDYLLDVEVHAGAGGAYGFQVDVIIEKRGVVHG